MSSPCAGSKPEVCDRCCSSCGLVSFSVYPVREMTPVRVGIPLCRVLARSTPLLLLFMWFGPLHFVSCTWIMSLREFPWTMFNDKYVNDLSKGCPRLVQGPSQKRGRAAASKATQASATDSAHPLATTARVEKRAPALSVGCLCHLLNAITEDGLVADTEGHEVRLN